MLIGRLKVVGISRVLSTSSKRRNELRDYKPCRMPHAHSAFYKPGGTWNLFLFVLMHQIFMHTPHILNLSCTDTCVAFATTTAGHAESYACGVQLRPQPVARETEAGKAVWEATIAANIRAKNPPRFSAGVCQQKESYYGIYISSYTS